MDATIKYNKFNNLLQFMSGHIRENYVKIMLPFQTWLICKGVDICDNYIKDDYIKDDFDYVISLDVWPYCINVSKYIFYNFTLLDDLDNIHSVVIKYCKTDTLENYIITLMIYMLKNGYPDVPCIADIDYEFDCYELISLEDEDSYEKYKKYADWIHDNHFDDRYIQCNNIQLSNTLLALNAFKTTHDIDIEKYIKYVENWLE